MRNHLWEDMTVWRGRRRLATKIDVIFFVGNVLLNIFYLTIFSKKKKPDIFQNNGKNG